MGIGSPTFINLYCRKEIVGGWKASDFQRLTLIQMNRTQQVKPKTPAPPSKQRVPLVVPKPFSSFTMNHTDSPGTLDKGDTHAPPIERAIPGTQNMYDKDQVVCHRCKVCDYKHGHLVKVREF